MKFIKILKLEFSLRFISKLLNQQCNYLLKIDRTHWTIHGTPHSVPTDGSQPHHTAAASLSGPETLPESILAHALSRLFSA